MRYSLFFSFLFLTFFMFSQNDYEITVYNKCNGKQITDYKFTQTDTSISIYCCSKEITMSIKKRDLDVKYLYLFIDTLNNDQNCWKLFAQGNTDAAIVKIKKDCYNSIHFHGVRNTPYSDQNPVNAFNASDFFKLDDDLFLNANISWLYKGFAYGGSLKYVLSAFGGYGFIVFDMNYSRVFTGPLKGMNEFSTGFMMVPLPIGIQVNSLFLNEKYCVNARPTIGVDLGQITLTYGYDIKLVGDNIVAPKNRHCLSIGLGLNLSRPVKNYRNKFPEHSFR